VPECLVSSSRKSQEGKSIHLEPLKTRPWEVRPKPCWLSVCDDCRYSAEQNSFIEFGSPRWWKTEGTTEAVAHKCSAG
jgi:hypothetical protein